MPSGSRKRKAAKKKQGKFAHSSANPSAATTSSTHGDEGLKHHETDDDHKSDGEEGVVKATEDAKNGDVQVEKEAGQNDDGVHAEGGPNTSNGFDQKKGDSSSSSSSSDSDDDSREVENSSAFVENAPVIDLVKAEQPVSELPVEVTHAPLVTTLEDPEVQSVSEVVGENIPVLDEKVLVEFGASADSSTSPNVVEWVHKENLEANTTSVVESDKLPEVIKELAPEDQKESGIVENTPQIDLVEEEHPVSQLPIEVTHTPLVTKLDDSEAECVSEVVEENISVLDEKVLVESGASADSSTSPGVVELGHKENGEANMSSPEESARLPEVIKELAPEDQKESGVAENAREIDLVEEENLVSELPVEVTHTPLVTNLIDPVAESVSEVVGENIPVLNEKVLVVSGSPADCSTSPDVVKLGQNEKEEVKLSSSVESAGLSDVTKELAPETQKNEENALPEVAKEPAPEDNMSENFNVGATSEVTVHKNEEKLMLSYNPPRVDTTGYAEDWKESEVIGSVDSQARVTSTVQPHQPTSWKSCCGLFEAFAGNNR